MANRKELIEVEKASKAFNIPNRTERIFRVFLGQVFPNAEISYESTMFTSIDGKETTVPDFKVIKPNGKIIFIEITKERRNGADPKERERRIMKEAAPDYPYVVLYNGALKKIQTKYKGFDFFKTEKKRGKEREISSETKYKFIKANYTESSRPNNQNLY